MEERTKFAATVKVGEKGQFVVPKEIRDMFHIRPGDTLLILADLNQGIALVKDDAIFEQFAGKLGMEQGGATGNEG